MTCRSCDSHITYSKRPALQMIRPMELRYPDISCFFEPHSDVRRNKPRLDMFREV
jgi:hypothetical protein